MSRCLRIFWLLLCLVLAARGSAAAILPITDARWHDHPVAEGAALIEQAPFLGLHDETATDRSSMSPCLSRTTTVVISCARCWPQW